MKNLILIVACALSSVFFWLKVKPWLNDPLDWSRIELWLWPMVLLLVYLSLTALAFLLLPKYYGRLVVVIIPGVFYLFMFGMHYFIWLGALAACGLGLWAMGTIRKEKESRLIFNLGGILKGGMHRLLTATFIMISLAYFLTPAVQAAALRKELPPGMARAVQVIVGSYLDNQLEVDNPRLIAQMNDKILNQINVLLKPYFQYIPPLLAFSLFLVLQGLSVIFLWLTMLLSRGIFLILKWFKIITMGKVTKEAEVVVF